MNSNTQQALEGLKAEFQSELDYALPEKDGEFKAWMIGNLAEIVRNRVQCSDFAEMLQGAGRADLADAFRCECGDPQCLEPFDGEVEARDSWFAAQEQASREHQWAAEQHEQHALAQQWAAGAQ